MKKLLLLLAVFSLVPSLFADDTRVYHIGGSAGSLAGGDNAYRLGQDDDIAMTAENVIITMYDDRYSVDATFWLKNEGKEKTISVGFPEHISELWDFCSYVNGKKVETAKYADKDAEYTSDWAENWYVKQVHFLENQTTTTRVTYTCKYGVTSTGLYFGIDGSLDYIYGTGRTWKSSIGKITFDVRNLSGIVYVMGYRFLNKKYGSYSIDASGFNQVADNKVSFKWISPDTFRIEAENVEPESAAELLEIYLHRFSYQNVEDFMKRYPGKNPINARCDFTRAFLKYDLRFMTENQLRLARNDFYALYGRGFQSKEIRDFYESINGYKVSKDYSDDLLSEEEKQIINRIIEIENGRKKNQ